ncbi:hypothetical protein DOTSEDRAFT_69863 [Dothistroma septosporum NZE10]|uniref:Uncharacterized protein n=1 Tax=Dothistroma septosporum (strain NZE10 / CBS 128990) TaxID=675120 RepID=N1Q0S8_DOTSN|nr:hypothetical protein DOTSEDRAFT_69863 [Dothistroma septosporum NZE10]
MDLPGEIRDNVYEKVFEGRPTRLSRNSANSDFAIESGLARTCKQVRSEMLNLALLQARLSGITTSATSSPSSTGFQQLSYQSWRRSSEASRRHVSSKSSSCSPSSIRKRTMSQLDSYGVHGDSAVWTVQTRKAPKSTFSTASTASLARTARTGDPWPGTLTQRLRMAGGSAKQGRYFKRSSKLLSKTTLSARSGGLVGRRRKWWARMNIGDSLFRG